MGDTHQFPRPWKIYNFWPRAVAILTSSADALPLFQTNFCSSQACHTASVPQCQSASVCSIPVHKEGDAWVEKATRGLMDEWEDESGEVWSDVTGLIRFWDESHRKKKCVVPARGETRSPRLSGGAPSTKDGDKCLVRILLMLKSLGVHCFLKFEEVVRRMRLSHMHVAFFGGILCTRVDRNRAPHPCVDLWVSCGWVCVALRRDVCEADGCVFSCRATMNML